MGAASVPDGGRPRHREDPGCSDAVGDLSGDPEHRVTGGLQLRGVVPDLRIAFVGEERQLFGRCGREAGLPFLMDGHHGGEMAGHAFHGTQVCAEPSGEVLGAGGHGGDALQYRWGVLEVDLYAVPGACIPQRLALSPFLALRHAGRVGVAVGHRVPGVQGLAYLDGGMVEVPYACAPYSTLVRGQQSLPQLRGGGFGVPREREQRGARGHVGRAGVQVGGDEGAGGEGGGRADVLDDREPPVVRAVQECCACGAADELGPDGVPGAPEQAVDDGPILRVQVQRGCLPACGQRSGEGLGVLGERPVASSCFLRLDGRCDEGEVFVEVGEHDPDPGGAENGVRAVDGEGARYRCVQGGAGVPGECVGAQSADEEGGSVVTGAVDCQAGVGGGSEYRCLIGSSKGLAQVDVLLPYGVREAVVLVGIDDGGGPAGEVLGQRGCEE